MPLKLVRSPNTGRYYPVNIAGELPTDEEKDRIKNYITQRERGVPSVDSQIESETAYKPRSGIFGAIDVSTTLNPTVGVGSTGRMYLYHETNEADARLCVVQGYRIGA